jgi:hypothetical protein
MADFGGPCCACRRVNYTPVEHPDGSLTERWACADCDREFIKRLAQAEETSVTAQKIDYRPTIGATLDPRYRQRHDIPWSQPLPLVEEPVAEKPEPPASEPSDDELRNLAYSAAKDEVGREGRTTEEFAVAERRALYNAGRASRDAQVAELKRELRELDTDSSERFQRVVEQRAAYSRELEAERTAHAATKAELDEVIRGLYARLREVHAEARKARSMPSAIDIEKAIRGASNGFISTPDMFAITGALQRLFGAQEEQDSVTPEAVHAAADGMPPRVVPSETEASGHLERIERLERLGISNHSRFSKLERWQRHIEAHHQPAEHSRRIGELAKRISKLEKGA